MSVEIAYEMELLATMSYVKKAPRQVSRVQATLSVGRKVKSGGVAARPIELAAPLPGKINRWVALCGLTMVASLAVPLVWQWFSPNIIHVNVVDRSASAKALGDLPERVCRAASDHYEFGDRSLEVVFAAQAEVSGVGQMTNALSALAQCSAPPVVSGNLGQRPGTSLTAALNAAELAIKSERKGGNDAAVLMSVVMHEAEPGWDEPVDWGVVREQMQQITEQRGVIAIVGSTGQFHQTLMRELGELPQVQVCAPGGEAECLARGFRSVRSL